MLYSFVEASRTAMMSISSHVLDITIGEPADGVPIIAHYKDNGNRWRQIGRTITGKNGRVSSVSQNFRIRSGIYKLYFGVEDYYRKKGIDCFYPYVEVIEFDMVYESAEVINKKLLQEEEWLKNFRANTKRSIQLREAIDSITDKFMDRLVSLQENVMPMHEVNGRLQVKQKNIQRLIKTIDTTIQFYGRTSELESSIKDGNPGHDLEAYLENMECLQQAVQFFESHPNYQNQTDNMRMTLETGYSVLETEYRSVVQKNTMQADPAVVIESLDDHYELLGSRAKDIKTVRDISSMIRLGVWLLERERSRFLMHYAKIRGENMMKTINAVAQHHTSLNAKTHSRAGMIKNALKKATGRNEKLDRRSGGIDFDGSESESALLMAGCLLALLEVEEAIMVKTIPDTTKRAQVFRELVANPLGYVVRHIQKIVQDNDKGVLPLLPLLRFLSAHQTRLSNLAMNSMADIPFEALMRLLRVKSSSHINEFVEKLKNDNNKFVPIDGNVHPITANTVNFLATLTIYRHTVTQQLLFMTAPQGANSTLLLPKLFARILSALGLTLNKKSENYEDPALSSIFLLNNFNYIAKALEDDEDGLLPVINEQNNQILSFYHSEIEQHLNRYMRSWNQCISTLQGIQRLVDDKNLIRNILTNFTREFDAVISQQRDYCIADLKLRDIVRAHVKKAVMPLYITLIQRTEFCGPQFFIRQTKYTKELLESSIDRLFDASVSRTTGRVLLMCRGPTAKFMPNALVFPGGVIADSDKLLGHPKKIAALRCILSVKLKQELFEETGVILGQKESAATSPELHELQEKTRNDANIFKLVCPSPPVDELIEWNTWLTPSTYKQRYMTTFYLAEIDGKRNISDSNGNCRISGEPTVQICEKEMSNHCWINPKECIERAFKGEVILPPPQVYELTRISQVSYNELQLYGNTTHVLCPQIINWSDGSHITNLLPGDHLYIDKDSFHQPSRELSPNAIEVDMMKPTHRLEYRRKPLYVQCKYSCIAYHESIV
ncbi:Exo70 exocyst complex subunit [Dictyocaulus viviparus]|uniref:Exocyst complex component 7 n=1 Tax=Dictyocaulus viviparus TaxID=29172 RepID=A0A0D8XNI8_DICVI|nr:Exo70 exocyst complex subunit [Dictyocaulus viviparus]